MRIQFFHHETSREKPLLVAYGENLLDTSGELLKGLNGMGPVEDESPAIVAVLNGLVKLAEIVTADGFTWKDAGSYVQVENLDVTAPEEQFTMKLNLV